MSAPTEAPAGQRRPWHDPLVALSFLTVVPVPPRLLKGAAFDLGRAAGWFPLAGGAVGALAGGVAAGLRVPLGAAPSAVLAVVSGVLLTGGLHQDGLADSADALGARGGSLRRLDAMRDSAVGAFGVLALVLWALLLVSVLSALPAARVLRTLVAAGAAGRLAIIVHRLAAPPARRDGLGAALAPRRAATALGTLLTAGICLLSVGPARSALVLALCLASGVLTGRLARRGAGGSTGDTLGAAAALTEVVVCLGLLATWR